MLLKFFHNLVVELQLEKRSLSSRCFSVDYLDQLAHARKNITLANRCNDLVLRSKGTFHITVHHVFGHAGNAGNECADCAASFGLRGHVSRDNIPSLWPDRRLLIHPLLSVLHCLSRVAEVLHRLVVELQLE